ncbi:MAG: hypothetical protein JW913_08590 [Chitinispirillaceae bacterium]|nr:hypothetical protein [Chitinispirillaceae bacterium]
MMRSYILLYILLGVIGTVQAYDIAGLAAQVKMTYDRIETFSADAYVYEYYG